MEIHVPMMHTGSLEKSVRVNQAETKSNSSLLSALQLPKRIIPFFFHAKNINHSFHTTAKANGKSKLALLQL